MTAHKTIIKDFELNEIAIQNNFQNLNRFIDHTLLKPDASKLQFEKLFDEAILYNFRTVCIPPTYVKLAANYFKSNAIENTGVCSVVSFPLGYSTSKNKIKETIECLKNGATEIDFVQNVTFVKNKQWKLWEEECAEILKVADENVVKIILETSLLTQEEIIECCKRALSCGVHYLKTSTGFGSRGATLEDLELMRGTLKSHDSAGIKASGGIKTRADAIAMIKAGATRLGTSNSVAIFKDLNSPEGTY